MPKPIPNRIQPIRERSMTGMASCHGWGSTRVREYKSPHTKIQYGIHQLYYNNLYVQSLQKRQDRLASCIYPCRLYIPKEDGHAIGKLMLRFQLLLPGFSINVFIPGFFLIFPACKVNEPYTVAHLSGNSVQHRLVKHQNVRT